MEEKNDEIEVIEQDEHHCSILVGKHVAYCMDCGQIYWEYKDKKIIKKLMNPYMEFDED